MIKWQAEQLPYPRDADYEGAMAGLFDLSDDAEEITGKLNAGDTFVYLFRRFGYPRFGWDGYKELVQYHITTPMEGVVLTVRPNVTGWNTFGYMLRDDIDQQCEKEERKPYEDWMEQFEAWALKEHDIEIIRLFEQDNDKLNRMWQKWGADKEDRDFASEKDATNAFFTDQEAIRVKCVDMYKEIATFPEITPLEDRPADSIMKQCHTALCDAIRDLLRPVYVRDVMITIRGERNDDEDAVKYARGSGCGVGDILADLERRGFCGE
jgi:hypothetical protein